MMYVKLKRLYGKWLWSISEYRKSAMIAVATLETAYGIRLADTVILQLNQTLHLYINSLTNLLYGAESFLRI
jgi:hypothetical protein